MNQQRYIERRAEFFARLRQLIDPIETIHGKSGHIAEQVRSIADDANLIANEQPDFEGHAGDITMATDCIDDALDELDQAVQRILDDLDDFAYAFEDAAAPRTNELRWDMSKPRLSAPLRNTPF